VFLCPIEILGLGEAMSQDESKGFKQILEDFKNSKAFYLASIGGAALVTAYVGGVIGGHIADAKKKSIDRLSFSQKVEAVRDDKAQLICTLKLPYTDRVMNYLPNLPMTAPQIKRAINNKTCVIEPKLEL
jgi:hypothetical protein